MDFISTLRVLGKHKILVAVLLVVTIGVTVVVVGLSARTKEASGSYVLLSAPEPERDPTGVTPLANNPFSAMDRATVVDILVRAMATEQIASELRSQGLVGDYRVAGNLDFLRGPMLGLTVTAPTAEDARAGYDLLASELSDTLRQRQIDAGADPNYLITMQRVSEPAITTPGLIGTIRSAGALLALGIIVTISAAILMERASARRRADRIAGAPGGESESSPDPERSDERVPQESAP